MNRSTFNFPKLLKRILLRNKDSINFHLFLKLLSSLIFHISSWDLLKAVSSNLITDYFNIERMQLNKQYYTRIHSRDSLNCVTWNKPMILLFIVIFLLWKCSFGVHTFSVFSLYTSPVTLICITCTSSVQKMCSYLFPL